MPSILLVEDDPASQRLLQKHLAANGYEVTVTSNGLEALMVLERLRPDLIICDIMMPKLDGIEFARAIKGQPDTKRLPIIFLTAQTDPGTMVSGINVGARYYVTKPVDMKELLWKIKRVVK